MLLISQENIDTFSQAKALYKMGLYHKRSERKVSRALGSNQQLEINNFDILLVKKLSDGLSQEEISKSFKRKNIIPSSLISIEKRLNKLKI